MTPTQEKKQQIVLTEAYHSFEKSLNTHAFSKLNDKSVGEDMVQDTFVKTWTYLIKGGKIEMMKAFLYHVLNNLIVDEYRKYKMTSLDVLLEKGYEPSTEDSERLVNILDGKEAFSLIKDLPVTYQKVMRMRYLQDLTLKEISLITGQSKNAISVQTHRGLEKLKSLYHHV